MNSFEVSGVLHGGGSVFTSLIVPLGRGSGGRGARRLLQVTAEHKQRNKMVGQRVLIYL